MKLKLYGTSACHLCNEAESLLHELKDEFSIDIQLIDIADDESLIERYGISIPVLTNANNSELFWPFNGNDLRKWMKATQ
jgi:glutaredoxin